MLRSRAQSRAETAKTEFDQWMTLMTGAIQRMMPTPFPLLPVEMKTEKARAAVEVPSETVNPCPNYNFAQLEAIADYQVMGYKPVAVPDALDHIQVVMNKSFRYVPPYVGPSTSLIVGACKDHVLFLCRAGRETVGGDCGGRIHHEAFAASR
jgi:hypothetical protein